MCVILLVVLSVENIPLLVKCVIKTTGGMLLEVRFVMYYIVLIEVLKITFGCMLIMKM